MAGNPAVAQHRSDVAKLLDFIQLVADVENAATLSGELAQRIEQLAHRLRCQHRGRLIHDQQFRVLQQATDDFDALALAHRQRVHQALRVYRQSVAIGYFGNLCGECVQVRIAGQRQCHVFDHGQGFEQRKMLKNHADAEATGMCRILHLKNLAFPFHFPAHPDA